MRSANLPLRLFSLVLALPWLTMLLASSTAAVPSYAGKWKILVPQEHHEISMWIVQINEKGNEAKLLWGLGRYNKAKIARARFLANTLFMNLTQGDAKFDLAMRIRPTVNKRLPGSIRIGSTILPAWMEPTDQVKVDDKKAARLASGEAELQKALAISDPAARYKAVRAVAAAHPDDVTAFLVQQSLLAGMIRDKAPATALATVVNDYRKLAARHGDELLVGTNLDLARTLLPYAPAADLAADCARAAIKLFRADHPIETQIAAQLTLAAALMNAGKKDETKDVAAALDKLAVGFIQKAGGGEEGKLQSALQIADALLFSRAVPVSEVGLGYARMAVTQIKNDTPVAQRAAAYRALVRGLEKHGKVGELNKTRALLEHFERQLDDDYRKTAIPFKTAPATPRKSKSTRVVLVELFTTSEAQPCFAADAAFDAARRVYAPSDAIFLRYHVHVNMPDVLANPVSMARQAFYSGEIEETIPAALVDGQMTPALGGASPRARPDFETLKKCIDREREKAAGATITLTGTSTAGKFTVRARVSELGETGAKVRLRLVVVEDEVRYDGGSGRRLHGQVVRGWLGDPAGYKLDKSDSSHTATLDVAALRKALDAYRSDYARKVGYRWGDQPRELKKLAVVAFVQDDESKKVYQAARIEVPMK